MTNIINRGVSLANRARKAEITKVFSASALSTLVKMLTGFVSIKAISVILGPEGLAIVGNLNNFIAIMTTVACVGINSGVTKYISQYGKSTGRVKDLISTGFKITLWGSAACGLFSILFSNFLSQRLMNSPDYRYVFIIFGFTVFFLAFNGFLLSIVNGFKEFGKFIRVNIANSIIGLIFSLTLLYLFGLKGALIGVVTYQSVMVFVTIYLVRKDFWLSAEYFKKKFDKFIAKKYLHYTFMAMVTASMVPVSQLILREHVITSISATQAGWWEAMNRLSNVYLMVVTTSFSVYYLPRLSEIRTKEALRHEIFKAYKVIIPSLLAGFTLIYLMRFIIIRILFTKEFLPMENLFLWQLSGDLFKMSSWILGFLFIAKRMTRMFVTTEVLSTLSFIAISFLFIKLNGVVGITQAYCLNYIFYLSALVIIFRKLLFSKQSAY